ncbi:unnamed protein product [Coffea canephora]|uniref:Uncharacterized protein n=2 Tax=Coffea TaxID=13442 RepID=A0A068TRJ5_COFCA|nr:unnamed protein product [Coffea canephora]
MANFCCSIELEPRTLRQGQIDQAREVAVDIMQKKEQNEASSILVEGLKPVASIKEMVMAVQEIDMLHEEDEAKDKIINSITETCCQCSSISTTIDSPNQSLLKEPVSAPF